MTQEEFTSRLAALCQEAGVELSSHDDYDGADEYCGTTYEFYGPTWAVTVDQSLIKTLDKVVPAYFECRPNQPVTEKPLRTIDTAPESTKKYWHDSVWGSCLRGARDRMEQAHYLWCGRTEYIGLDRLRKRNVKS